VVTVHAVTRAKQFAVVSGDMKTLCEREARGKARKSGKQGAKNRDALLRPGIQRD
jgi:hypothetical protein